MGHINKNMNAAKAVKNDEFYTQISDIERECSHYYKHFQNKTILCNCDDPRASNFFRYFYMNFRHLGLSGLIATCYKNCNPNIFSMNQDEQAIYCIYDGKNRKDDVHSDYETFIQQNEWQMLKGNGDFRSAECVELLKQADIVCTNPPFSLFREYAAQLMKYDKKFLIIGNKNAAGCKEIFPLIKENKIWWGCSSPNDFILHGQITKKVTGLTRWFTNLAIEKHHEKMILYKKYNPEEYPKYDNYDAINVDQTNDIPCDYDGIMGVPITFLDKYNPHQFEIVGITEANGKGNSNGLWKGGNPKAIANGKEKFTRRFIKNKQLRQIECF